MVFYSLSARLPVALRLIPPIFSTTRSFVCIPFPGFPSTDEDTAQYLSEALATSSQDQRPRGAMDVKNALEEARTRRETKELGFEDRISAALSILGVPRDTECIA
jgi:hypothetical protein